VAQRRASWVRQSARATTERFSLRLCASSLLRFFAKRNPGVRPSEGTQRRRGARTQREYPFFASVGFMPLPLFLPAPCATDARLRRCPDRLSGVEHYCHRLDFGSPRDPRDQPRQERNKSPGWFIGHPARQPAWPPKSFFRPSRDSSPPCFPPPRPPVLRQRTRLARLALRRATSLSFLQTGPQKATAAATAKKGETFSLMPPRYPR
jgi:hypothetical protein